MPELSAADLFGTSHHLLAGNGRSRAGRKGNQKRLKMTDQPKSIFNDLEKLRLSEADVGLGGLEQEVETRIATRKPSGREFFRVHPDMALTTTILIDREEMRSDVYLVAPPMRDQLPGDLRPAVLVPAITRQGSPMIWPIPLAIEGRPNEWHERARRAAERAKTKWVRMVADVPLGTYRIYEALGELPEPPGPISPSRNSSTSRSPAS